MAQSFLYHISLYYIINNRDNCLPRFKNTEDKLQQSALGIHFIVLLANSLRKWCHYFHSPCTHSRRTNQGRQELAFREASKKVLFTPLRRECSSTSDSDPPRGIHLPHDTKTLSLTCANDKCFFPSFQQSLSPAKNNFRRGGASDLCPTAIASQENRAVKNNKRTRIGGNLLCLRLFQSNWPKNGSKGLGGWAARRTPLIKFIRVLTDFASALTDRNMLGLFSQRTKLSSARPISGTQNMWVERVRRRTHTLANAPTEWQTPVLCGRQLASS